jgi:hypothetical protein
MSADNPQNLHGRATALRLISNEALKYKRDVKKWGFLKVRKLGDLIFCDKN